MTPGQSRPRHPGRISSRALDYLREVVEYGFGNSSGPNLVGRLEQAFARRFGVGHAIALCNGTATMHSCLAAAGVKPGDEVIVPPLTMGATAFCAMHQGAVPVFADVDPQTFNLDPGAVRQRLSPLTRAIIPVGLYGLSADLDPIMALAREHGLSVIEDNAECVLGLYKGRIAGTTAPMASFSFQSSKHLTCGEGGMVITQDPELATMVRRFACFGYPTLIPGGGGAVPKECRGHPTSVRHEFLGWNYRMSDLQAAVALEQVERIDELVHRRQRIGQLYHEALQGCRWLVPQYTPPDCVHSYWTLACRFEAAVAGCSWDEFRTRFFRNGGHFVYGAWRLTYQEPMFQQRRFLGDGFPIDSEIYRGQYRSFAPGLCPVAESLQPKLMQFKTNYVDLDEARRQIDILRQTIAGVDAG